MAHHFQRQVAPDLTVAVDDATCIVLRTPERTVTVSSVDALVAALEDARVYAKVEFDERTAPTRCVEEHWVEEAPYWFTCVQPGTPHTWHEDAQGRGWSRDPQPTEGAVMPAIPTPDELADRMNTLYADHREDLDRLTALEKLWVDEILPMYPTNPPAARALWDEAAHIATARDLERQPTPPTPKDQP
jgi:hypothetical protein